MNEEKKKQVKEGKVEKMSQFFIDYVDAIPTMEGKIAVLFYGYFKNKMQIVIHTLAFPHIKRDPAQLDRTIHSLNDIFHHFSPEDAYHIGLFEELLGILKKIPNITEQECGRGLDIVEEIFKIFDLETGMDKEFLLKEFHKTKEKREKREEAAKKGEDPSHAYRKGAN